MSLFRRIYTRIQYATLSLQNRWRLLRLTREVARQAAAEEGKKPVVFFNASARLHGLSLNAAFQLLTAWGLRLAGIPVVHFVCGSGMSRCVLGTDRDNHAAGPPCRACIAQSRRIYRGAEMRWFGYEEDEELADALGGLNINTLMDFEYQGAPLGQIVLPSLRWALRRHRLPDDEGTRYLMCNFILSAYNVGKQFSSFLGEVNPAAVVVFNGIMYPEAMVKRAAYARGIRVITHEVGFQPFSAFFTEGEATAYPIHIPDDFELSKAQNARLDAYLEARFQGEFTMAGIRFWPEMRGLDEEFKEKTEGFERVVPVFTNVIFDTSQVHANTAFEHMFAWLDLILEIIQGHPETLFVIRAHPDEMRPGTKKQSRESVRQWVRDNGVDDLPNVIFIDSGEYISSYALIQRAKFVMVYNSSIGLEATLLGVPVLCGGRARYTQYPTVFFPDTSEGYRLKAEDFLAAEHIEVPEEFRRNARRFLYYQLFRTALPFGEYLDAHPRPGYVLLKPFQIDALAPQHSDAIGAIRDGVVSDGPFLV